MKKLGWLLVGILCCSFLNMPHLNLARRYLSGRIPEHNHRYQTFTTALQLMKAREVKTIVETGTSRGGLGNFEGDGGSSIIFSHFAHDNRGDFFSVDIDQNALNHATNAVKSVLGPLSSHIQFVCQDSVTFLRDFPRTIDFLYLDSYDFDSNNPVPSQEHHLREIEAAYPHLTPQTIIMIDDCDLPHGGKGKLVIDFLLQRGWKILEKRYQVILIHEQS